VKETLLLHTCCAVCACAALNKLCGTYAVTLYFYNPNINTQEEHAKRAAQLEKLHAAFDIADIITVPYAPQDFFPHVADLTDLPERGARCQQCITLRLKNAATYAAKNGYAYYTTTLSASPHKDANFINSTGGTFVEPQSPTRFLPADFKKQNGFLFASQTAQKLDIYRQTYCGCVK